MNNNDFTKTFQVEQSPAEIFEAIKEVRSWWSGLYGDELEGSSEKPGDEFTFHAGGGMHYSKQKLTELIPHKKIVWLVTDSNLNFLEKPNEWTGTKICFDISKQGNKTQVRFTHVGLVPKIECYNNCSSAWNQYLHQFLSPLITKAKG